MGDAFAQIEKWERRREKLLLRHQSHKVPKKGCYFCRLEQLEEEKRLKTYKNFCTKCLTHHPLPNCGPEPF